MHKLINVHAFQCRTHKPGLTHKKTGGVLITLSQPPSCLFWPLLDFCQTRRILSNKSNNHPYPTGLPCPSFTSPLSPSLFLLIYLLFLSYFQKPKTNAMSTVDQKEGLSLRTMQRKHINPFSFAAQKKIATELTQGASAVMLKLFSPFYPIPVSFPWLISWRKGFKIRWHSDLQKHLPNLLKPCILTQLPGGNSFDRRDGTFSTKLFLRFSAHNIVCNPPSRMSCLNGHSPT